MATGRPYLRAEEVDGAGLAVIAGEDAGDGALLRGQGVVDLGDLLDHLVPAEAVGVELGQDGGGVGLGVFGLEVHGLHPRDELLRREDGDGEGHGEDESDAEEQGIAADPDGAQLADAAGREVASMPPAAK